MISIQILLNVMKTTVAVVRYAITLKEALNVPVMKAIYLIVMETLVQVRI